MSDLTWRKFGDDYYVTLDADTMLVVKFENLRRAKDGGGLVAQVTATRAGVEIGWNPLTLASDVSRKTYAKNASGDIDTDDLRRACRLIDRLWREAIPVEDLSPRRPAPGSWFIQDWMPARSTSVLYCDGGTGKSIFALYLAVSAIVGVPFGGPTAPWRPAPIYRCLYLDFEDDREGHDERLHGILHASGLKLPSEDRIKYMGLKGYMLSEQIERVRRACDEFNIDLVILDSISLAASTEVEGADAAIRTLGALGSLQAQTRIALGHVNAVGRQQSEGIPSLYGSVFFSNIPRAVIYLARERIGEYESHLTAHLVKHNRGPAKHPVGWKMVFDDTPGSTNVGITSTEPDMTRAPLKLKVIQELRRGKMDTVLLAAACGCTPDTLRPVLAALLKNRVINHEETESPGGRGRKSYWGLVDKNRVEPGR